jgi:hypothetical protein
MMASHNAQASGYTTKPEMPDKRTDDIRALLGHIDQVATRSSRKFNSIYDTLLKKCGASEEKNKIDYSIKYVRGPRYPQHG